MRCGWLALPLMWVAAALAVMPAAAQPDEAFAELYAQRSLELPTTERMTVCYGFGCTRRMELNFTEADGRTVTRIFARGKASAQAERLAVAQAVAWFDRRVGPLTGTDHRVAHADIRTLDAAHNFDCIDTSTNTTSLLLVLADWNLLRFHDVGLPRYRGNLLVGQMSHNTGVLVERASGQGWSVDMWTTSYGDPAEMMPIEKWMDEK